MNIKDFIKWLEEFPEDTIIEVDEVIHQMSHFEYYTSRYSEPFDKENPSMYSYYRKTKTLKIGGE